MMIKKNMFINQALLVIHSKDMDAQITTRGSTIA